LDDWREFRIVIARLNPVGWVRVSLVWLDHWGTWLGGSVGRESTRQVAVARVGVCVATIESHYISNIDIHYMCVYIYMLFIT
jgi:hypothetical protein